MNAEIERRVSPYSVEGAIIHTVARLHRVSVEDMLSTSRDPDHVAARYEAMAQIRRLLNWSLPRIGELFHRHHTTVLYAVQTTNLGAA